MIKDFIYSSRKYLILFFVMFLLCSYAAIFHYNVISSIDLSVSNFVSKYLVKDYLTPFFKLVTNMGGVWFFVVCLLLVLVFVKNKKFFYSMSSSLLFTYLLSVVLKNIYRRERPPLSLISLPSDYSFPSGHTMCSIVFYGFLLYLIGKYVNNKTIKCILYILVIFVFISIAFSRVYLGVHHFSDVICGFIFGMLCLLMCVNYVKIKKIV